MMLLAGSIAVAGVAAGVTYGVVSPGSGLFGEVIWRGNGDRVALTFDDGPTSPYTDKVLDILAGQGVKAAFFVIGKNVERYPEVVRRMHDEGHIVANHTYDHSHWGFLWWESYWREQIRRTDELIEAAIGVKPALFRAPLGFKNWWTISAAHREGHRVVAWSRRAYDGIRCSREGIVRRVGSRARGGEILTLHDGVEPHVRRDPSVTVDALPGVIGAIRARGLTVARLDELVGVRAYQSCETAAQSASCGASF